MKNDLRLSALSLAIQAFPENYTSDDLTEAAKDFLNFLDPPPRPEAYMIARVCHEVNRAYCAALGDNSQLPWEQAPEWQRRSAITGVNFIIDNPDAPPSASHDSWLAEKRADGWRYGEKKDVDLKEHPCFVEYDQLPPEQKAKDYIFQSIVRASITT